MELPDYTYLNHPQGIDYENWMGAWQAEYYASVIVRKQPND